MRMFELFEPFPTARWAEFSNAPSGEDACVFYGRAELRDPICSAVSIGVNHVRIGILGCNMFSCGGSINGGTPIWMV